MKQPTKKTFEVGQDETIDQCLDRMKKEGYMPVKRIEKPIFMEVESGNKTEFEPIFRKIIFEGRKIE
ncbi:NETI motif-containing protein [Peribacillus acanthi]|uniref:NETI motif-containing protein n=1 Tax=Peribacillus acanthi TaxID=2171554 RepID=UPI000D3E68BB|nr:NETI motif-containing protein [Peribacillus acanthi]